MSETNFSNGISSLVIVGCGNIGRRIIGRLKPAELPLFALMRSADTVRFCRERGVLPLQVDLDNLIDMQIQDLPDGAAVIYLAPPPRQGTTDTRLEGFLRLAGHRVERLVLISTTGVYGDCGGSWIDESQAPAPATDRARRRLDAENQVRRWATNHDRGYVILRVPGIYAEDRLPLARLQRGEAMIENAASPFTNRIHAEDLARICISALSKTDSRLLLNASDGHPTTMTEYFNRVADAVGLDRPPVIDRDSAFKTLSPGMLSYLAESRRIDNRRLLRALDIELEYPSLDDTLRLLSGPAFRQS